MIIYSRAISRLKLIYPITNKLMEKYVSRDIVMKRLVHYLHNTSFGNEINENIENVQYFEAIGFSDFKFLVELEESGKLDKFVAFIKNVKKEKINEAQNYYG